MAEKPESPSLARDVPSTPRVSNQDDHPFVFPSAPPEEEATKEEECVANPVSKKKKKKKKIKACEACQFTTISPMSCRMKLVKTPCCGKHIHEECLVVSMFMRGKSVVCTFCDSTLVLLNKSTPMLRLTTADMMYVIKSESCLLAYDPKEKISNSDFLLSIAPQSILSQFIERMSVDGSPKMDKPQSGIMLQHRFVSPKSEMGRKIRRRKR